MISIEVSETPDGKWNERLKLSDSGNIYQTKELSILMERGDQNPKFLKFVDGKGEVVAQLLHGNVRRFGSTKTKSRMLNKLPGIKKKLIAWSYGPVIINEDYTNEIFLVFQDYLLKQSGIVNGKLHPFISNSSITLKNNFKLKEWGTYLIDLQDTKENLFSKIDKHSGRNNIKRSLKRGVKIEEINEQNISDYVKLRNNNIATETNKVTEEGMIEWLEILKPIGYSGYLARLDDKPISALFFSFFNKLIIEGGLARSKIDFQQKLYSQDLIKWKIIEWGVDNKMKYFDLAGFNPYPKNPKEEGIKRYKAKWGGKSVIYGILTKK